MAEPGQIGLMVREGLDESREQADAWVRAQAEMSRAKLKACKSDMKLSPLVYVRSGTSPADLAHLNTHAHINPSSPYLFHSMLNLAATLPSSFCVRARCPCHPSTAPILSFPSSPSSFPPLLPTGCICHFKPHVSVLIRLALLCSANELVRRTLTLSQ